MPKICKTCKHQIVEVNFALGKEYMHVNPSTSFPTTSNGGYWRYCKKTVADPLTKADEELYRFAERAARQAGMDASICFTLLSAGWRYVERINEIARWEHPMWQATESDV